MNDEILISAGVRAWLGNAQRGFLALAVAAITSYVYVHREIASATLMRLNFAAIVSAVIIMLALHLIIVLSFHWLHRGLGLRRPLPRAFASYFARLPGRFLPGGVWHSVLRYADLHSEQAISARSLGIIFLGESGLLAISGLSAAGIFGLIAFERGSSAFWFAVAILGGGLGLGAVLFVLWQRNRQSRELAPLAIAFALMVTAWVGTALAFTSLAVLGAEPMLPLCNTGVVMAAYLCAASIGFVAVFAPQGWGVTEFIFVQMHPCAAPAATLVTAVFAFRLVSFGSDAVAFISATLIRAAATRLFPRVTLATRGDIERAKDVH